MKTYIDCIPCFTRHTLEAARNLGLSDSESATLMNDVLGLLQKLDWQAPPPVMATEIHRVIKKRTGNPDPYLAQKTQSTTEALRLLPDIERTVAEAKKPFTMAVRFSIAGNAIDLGAKTMNQIDITQIFESARDAWLCDRSVAQLEQAIHHADNVLFLTDNAGEIVFDIPLLEQIGAQKLTVAVRGEPAINDATLADAQLSGIADRFSVITNGADTPGTWLPYCSSQFVEIFNDADLVIAKGQGNYETLSEAPQNIFFLFLVKCPVIAADANIPLHTYTVRYSQNRPEKKDQSRDKRTSE